MNLREFVFSKLQCALLRTLKLKEETIKIWLLRAFKHVVDKKTLEGMGG